MAQLILNENAVSPNPPAAGQLAVYSKTDDKLYVKNSAGVESSVNLGAGGGTVTSVSVVSANGLAGTVATATTTPAITLTTSITGVLKGNGISISAASSGTDYSAGTNTLATGILKSTTTTGTLSIAVPADFPTLNQNTTGSAALNLPLIGGTLSGGLTIPAGTAATPALNFTGATTTGLWSPGAGLMSITMAGVETARWTAKGLSVGDTTPTAALYVKQSLTSDTGIVLGNSSNATKLSIDYSGANGWGMGFVGGNYQTYMSGNSVGNTSIGWMSFGPGGSASMTPPWPIEFATASVDGVVTSLSTFTPGRGNLVNGLPIVVIRNKSTTVNTLVGLATAGSSANPMSFAGTVNVVQTAGSEVSNYIVATQKAGTLTEALRILDTGQVKAMEAGAGFSVTEGSNCKQGTAVLAGGTLVVANTSVTANSRIQLTSQVDGGTPGFLRVSTRVVGTSFTILSSSATDTSTVAYFITEPS